MSDSNQADPKSVHAFCAAMLALQQAGPMLVSPNSKGQTGNRRYDYADLGDVMKVVQPRLADAGLILMQTAFCADGQAHVTTRLTTDGKNGIATTLSVEIPREGDRPAQVLGGLITYLRRYGVLVVTGAVVAGEDDDAASASVSDIRRNKPEPRRMPQPAPSAASAEPAEESPEHVDALRSAMKRACEKLHDGDVKAAVAAHLAPRGLKRVTDATPEQAAEIALEIDEAIAS